MWLDPPSLEQLTIPHSWELKVVSVILEVHGPHCSRVSLVLLVVKRSGTLSWHFPRAVRGHLLAQCLLHPHIWNSASKGSTSGHHGRRSLGCGAWQMYLQNDPMR